MKALYTLLIILLITQYNSEKCDGTVRATSVSECQSLTLVTGDYKCCLFEAEYEDPSGKDITIKTCDGVTKSEYDDIDKMIDFYEGSLEAFGYDVDDIDIDCGSKYLVISLISLALLLI